MSVQALSWVLENSESRLADRHVLISIANHAERDGTGAWPSVATIAHESRLSDRQVQRSIVDLEALGELFVERNAGPRGCNLYSLPQMQAVPLRQVVTLEENVTPDNQSQKAGTVTPSSPEEGINCHPNRPLTVLKENRPEETPSTNSKGQTPEEEERLRLQAEEARQAREDRRAKKANKGRSFNRTPTQFSRPQPRREVADVPRLSAAEQRRINNEAVIERRRQNRLGQSPCRTL